MLIKPQQFDIRQRRNFHLGYYTTKGVVNENNHTKMSTYRKRSIPCNFIKITLKCNVIKKNKCSTNSNRKLEAKKRSICIFKNGHTPTLWTSLEVTQKISFCRSCSFDKFFCLQLLSIFLFFAQKKKNNKKLSFKNHHS